VVDQIATISRHPYFAELPEHILKAVASRVAVRIYERGALVYLEGESSDGLYMEPSVVFLIRRAALLDSIREYPEIGIAVIGVLAAPR
jgi:signal-transduction protein with cAMP-binding, CBS, and nucleotidyltransferase domain